MKERVGSRMRRGCTNRVACAGEPAHAECYPNKRCSLWSGRSLSLESSKSKAGNERKGQETMSEWSWARFYQATKDHPHWALLERAVSLLSQPGHALDLGCGAGRDTRYLLAQGWRVTAVDREADAVAL